MKKKYSKSFQAWFNENKNSETFREDYANYKLDSKCSGEKPLTLKQWASEKWEENKILAN